MSERPSALPAALKAFLERGIPLIGAYPSKAAIASGGEYRRAFTSSPETIRALWEGRGDPEGRAKGTPIRLFRYIPGEAGFLCIDLDRGHEDGEDGPANFHVIFRREGIVLPAVLKALDAFPCYVRTPGGGIHLYFRYRGPRRYPHQYLAPAVEVFHHGSAMTAPGSEKDGRPYFLVGDLDAAPALPPIIERRLKLPADERPGQAPKPRFTYDRPDWERQPPPLDLVAEWAVRDGHYEGRNRLCFEVARRARRPDYAYTPDDVIAFLQRFPAVDGLLAREIETAVHSAFKGGYSCNKTHF